MLQVHGPTTKCVGAASLPDSLCDFDALLSESFGCVDSSAVLMLARVVRTSTIVLVVSDDRRLVTRSAAAFIAAGD